MLNWLRKIFKWLKGLFKRQEEPKPKFSIVIEGVEYATDDIDELNTILSQFGSAIWAAKQEPDKDNPK